MFGITPLRLYYGNKGISDKSAVDDSSTKACGNKKRTTNGCSFVRLIGLEPTRRKTPDPKSGASTNFATRATVFYLSSAMTMQAG